MRNCCIAQRMPGNTLQWRVWGTRSHMLQLRVGLPQLKTPQAAAQIRDPMCCDQDLVSMLSHSVNHVQLFATLWTVAHQAPLSMRFSRPEYWSGVPFPPPGDLPDPGILCLLHCFLPLALPGKPVLSPRPLHCFHFFFLFI